jgi:transcriptional regulator with XRE-family HTH domain
LFVGHHAPLLDPLVILEYLAFSRKEAHEKLAAMSIHKEIETARKRRGWSMEKLAEEVSKAEGLPKKLTWQTVQQWENGTSAPKRTRMQIVRRLLGLLESPQPHQYDDIVERVSAAELAMLENYRVLLSKDRERFDREIAALAKERQEETAEIIARARLAQKGDPVVSASVHNGEQPAGTLPLSVEEQARVDVMLNEGGAAPASDEKKAD